MLWACQEAATHFSIIFGLHTISFDCCIHEYFFVMEICQSKLEVFVIIDSWPASSNKRDI